MHKIYDPEQIRQAVEICRCGAVLSQLQVELFLIQYQRGELVTSPLQPEPLFQVMVHGSLHIYFIRDDGTRYSLSSGNADYILGEMDILYHQDDNVFTEASEDSLCLAFFINPNKEKLLSNNGFLRLICDSLSRKMGAMTTLDAAPSTLTERALSYMRYKCQGGVLRGVEQSAFQLHCSARQLQRVMNQCVVDGTVEKLGKGTYRLAGPGGK